MRLGWNRCGLALPGVSQVAGGRIDNGDTIDEFDVYGLIGGEADNRSDRFAASDEAAFAGRRS